MKGRVTLVAIAVAVALFVGAVTPPPAQAMDDMVKVGLITSAVVGGILILAIIGTSLTREDPRWLTETSPGIGGHPFPSNERVHFGSRCPQVGSTALAVCW